MRRQIASISIAESRLTIGIPTYNRKFSLMLILESLMATCEGELASLLIIDDASSDGTLELGSRYKSQNIRFLQNTQNLGYALTFCRLLEECNTDYILVTTDDDEIDVAALGPLVSWLTSVQPDFAATQWFFQNGINQRAKKSASIIGPEQLRAASNLAPGLIYKRSACLPFIDKLKAYIKAKEISAFSTRSVSSWQTSSETEIAGGTRVVSSEKEKPCRRNWWMAGDAITRTPSRGLSKYYRSTEC